MTTIDAQYVRVFCALARHLNMSHAARELEPALRHHPLPEGARVRSWLQALRADIAQDFAAPAGLEFRAEAKAILEHMSAARSKLRSWIDWRRGGLRIAASTTACQYILPLALREFRESFPDFSIQIYPCTEQQAVDRASVVRRPIRNAATWVVSFCSGLRFFVPQ